MKFKNYEGNPIIFNSDILFIYGKITNYIYM